MRALVLIAAMAGLGPSADAQPVQVATAPATRVGKPATPAAGPQTSTIVIKPRAIQRPALGYALMWRAEEMQEGNAAVKYLAAVEQMPRATAEDSEQVVKLLQRPLGELDEAGARKLLLPAGVRRLMRDGSRMELYDPETGVRTAGVTAILPGLSRYRQLINILALEIRLDIKAHRWEEAREKLAIGLGMARHLAQGQMLIEDLVGVALAGVMTRCVEDWMAEGGPNLYWSLVNMPRPFVDLRRAMSYERAMVTFTVPEFQEVRAGRFHVGQWHRLVKQMLNIRYGDDVPGLFSWEMTPLGSTFYGAAEYPRAKRFLEERGMSREEVERMPVEEVLSRFFVRSYDEMADEIFKGMGLPAWEVGNVTSAAERELRGPMGKANVLARILLPSLGRAVTTTSRADRSIDMMRVVEGIRAYAAEKKKLPENLEAAGLPMPADVTTGKPFGYEVSGGEARLTSPSPAGDPRGGAVIVIKLGQ